MWCPEPLAADTAAEVRSPSVAARAASERPHCPPGRPRRRAGARAQGTRHVLDLAARMRRCGAFVHVSSAYANGHLPRGRLVRERLYPPPGAGAGLLAAL